MGWDWYPPRSTPRRAAGGIQARSKRGDFGTTWWGKRWTAVLYELGMGARLGRGRSYARSGQVLSIDIEPGLVTARVQGSRPAPYLIAIRLRPVGEEHRAALREALSGQALIAAELLAGHLPEALEPVCAAAGIPLFPQEEDDLETDCSCPDWANPCKHIAAVYCLLAEAFDDDPFLVLKLRGLTREELTALVVGESGSAVAAPEPEPLPSDPELFWHALEPPPATADWRPPAVPAPLLRQLGAFPFWRGQTSLVDALEPIYRQATVACGQRMASPPAASAAESGS